MTKKLSNTEILILALILIFSLFIILADYLIPESIGLSILYVIPLFFSTYLFFNKKVNLILTIIYSFLTLFTFLFHEFNLVIISQNIITIFILVVSNFLSLAIIRNFEEKKKTDSLLNEAYNVTPSGVLVVDSEGRIKNFNKAFVDIFNLDAAKEIDAKLMNFFFGSDKGKSFFDLREVLEHQSKVIHLENEGVLSPIEVSYQELTVENSFYMFFTFENLSKKINQQISVNRLATVANFSNIGLININTQGNILILNQGAKNILNLNDIDDVNESLFDYFLTQDKEKLTELLLNVRRGKSIQDVEFLTKNKYGKKLLQTSFLPIMDYFKENVVEISVSFTDITEIRNYQKKLEKSKRDMEEYTYIVSHDLKAPLRHLSSYLQLLELEKVDLSDKGANYISKMKKSTKRMNDMISALLTYSRIGHEANELVEINLNTIFKEVVVLYDDIIKEHGIIISCDLEDKVLINRNHAFQLMQNFIDNSIKYRQLDRPLEIKITSFEKNDFLVLSFEDNGIGIDLDRGDNLFKVFSRLHSDNEIEGTGIGLASCKKIASFYDGHIEVESELGSYTKFFVHLKLVTT